jgi:hypothetical protein
MHTCIYVCKHEPSVSCAGNADTHRRTASTSHRDCAEYHDENISDDFGGDLGEEFGANDDYLGQLLPEPDAIRNSVPRTVVRARDVCVMDALMLHAMLGPWISKICTFVLTCP